MLHNFDIGAHTPLLKVAAKKKQQNKLNKALHAQDYFKEAGIEAAEVAKQSCDKFCGLIVSGCDFRGNGAKREPKKRTKSRLKKVSNTNKRDGCTNMKIVTTTRAI